MMESASGTEQVSAEAVVGTASPKATPKAKKTVKAKAKQVKHTGKASAASVKATEERLGHSIKGTPTEKAFDGVYAKWVKGARIKDLAKELKIRRGALRRQLRKRAGGKEGFFKLRAKGAGGVELRGVHAGVKGAKPKAKASPKGGAAKAPNAKGTARGELDAKAEFIPANRIKGWTVRDESGTKVTTIPGRGDYRAAAADEPAEIATNAGRFVSYSA